LEPFVDETKQIRDAVVKLEAKMEVMSDSMVSLANSVSKLADIRVELMGIKKDVSSLYKIAEKRDTELEELDNRVRYLEHSNTKNTYVIGKIDLVWGALLTGSVSLLYWLLKQ
jgi:chromosome segregation ATPase